tara:strand:- start:345 stop:590 length:246 start_codon:yes stop_codon:yes gene_type:complete
MNWFKRNNKQDINKDWLKAEVTMEEDLLIELTLRLALGECSDDDASDLFSGLARENYRLRKIISQGKAYTEYLNSHSSLGQ